MTEVDIGDPSPSVFTRLEYDAMGQPAAAFISRYGEMFCLARSAVELRIHYLEAHGQDIVEERRAMKALRAAHGA